MSAPKNMAKRTAAATVALAVCLSGGALAFAGAANADSSVKFNTAIAGATRYDTAIAAAKAEFTKGATDVVLVNASSDHAVDGLTASYLAGLKGAPILYTDFDSTPAVTTAEITALGAKNIWFVGGTAAISADQVSSWKSQTGVTATQIGGATRYDTAQAVAAAGPATRTTAFVASGDQAHLSDALAVGPVSYKTHFPILLTSDGDTPALGVTSALKTMGASPIVVGGTAVITATQTAALGATVQLGGTDKAETATKIADWAVANAGFSVSGVGISSGDPAHLSDSLVAAPVLGDANHPSPLLFAGAPETNTYISAHATAMTGTSYVFGGPSAVPQTAIDSANNAALSVSSSR